MRRALFAALCIACVACSGANGENRPQRPEEPVEPEGDSADPILEEEEEPDPRPELDPESACGRALACCRAYCEAVPDVVEDSACAGIYEALEAPDADARCGRMSVGWGQALERLSEDHTAPDVCGGAD